MPSLFLQRFTLWSRLQLSKERYNSAQKNEKLWCTGLVRTYANMSSHKPCTTDSYRHSQNTYYAMDKVDTHDPGKRTSQRSTTEPAEQLDRKLQQAPPEKLHSARCEDTWTYRDRLPRQVNGDIKKIIEMTTTLQALCTLLPMTPIPYTD